VLNENGNYYYLDFKLCKNGVDIDLEIDGKQHEYNERQTSDSKRDKYMNNIGFVVYRIKWNNINNEYGKQTMNCKIKDFLNFYNEI